MIAFPGAIGAVPLVVPDVACDDWDVESLLQGLWDFSVGGGAWDVPSGE